MEKSEVYIIGAGGHGKVVIDIVERMGAYSIVGVLDDDPVPIGHNFFGYPVFGDRSLMHTRNRSDSMFLVAIGNNRIRQQISNELANCGAVPISAIHPSAQLSRNVTIHPGTVVMACCVINADTVIGKNGIVNSHASVDHDCLIGDAVHIAPGTTVCGGVRIGSGTLIGAGTTILPGIHVGASAVVGAGSVVISDIADNQVVAGIPARPLN